MSSDEKQCPYCGEIIKKSAKKCRFCGEWLEQPTNYTNYTHSTQTISGKTYVANEQISCVKEFIKPSQTYSSPVALNKKIGGIFKYMPLICTITFYSLSVFALTELGDMITSLGIHKKSWLFNIFSFLSNLHDFFEILTSILMCVVLYGFVRFNYSLDKARQCKMLSILFIVEIIGTFILIMDFDFFGGISILFFVIHITMYVIAAIQMKQLWANKISKTFLYYPIMSIVAFILSFVLLISVDDLSDNIIILLPTFVDICFIGCTSGSKYKDRIEYIINEPRYVSCYAFFFAQIENSKLYSDNK